MKEESKNIKIGQENIACEGGYRVVANDIVTGWPL